VGVEDSQTGFRVYPLARIQAVRCRAGRFAFETEIITRVTDGDLLLPLFQSESASVVVCGHTHMQYHRTIGRIRLVNAGSVGAPYGEPGAYWLLLDSGIRLRHTTYDLAAAAERIRATAYPLAREFANAVLQPSSEEEMLGIYAPSELTWKG
jgi:diadenosine tetraphosphatase ApaH/serine/threonine PP2A family protein phosphatase